ncbi:DNA-binding transcriptional regulator, LysR family [Paenimyroides ummariense]|uniref:DNA-binding transcriptional regulator, LysR family n=1 Tax=Paenimyroides ummariense TaxID=913024 RepID=A0A1I5G0I3_9FLAO|nr:LysR family transcriptional regulator [Paenimyroides ummariense]SFO29502.1 DNA-binding transcriptional regulator, LysR family [Paenimyroides ummariense]
MINLEWYRTFKAIYKTGTLTGAAEALYISQPGVSLHLSSLEAYVGYKLFDRTSRKMIPTERAKVLFNAINEPLTKLEIVEKTFQKSTEKHEPTISIGMCFETFQTTLEPFVSSLDFNLIISFGNYPEMLDQLEKGILDLIITPKKGTSLLIDHEPFSSEKIILVGGKDVEVSEFNKHLKANDKTAIETWLKDQKWYGTTGDMEHLFQFWSLNFDKKPDFRPNYIVPNLNSIVRCLFGGSGLAVIPDLLCQKEINEGKIQLIWEGGKELINTLYFGSRKKSIHQQEINQIKELFKQIMPKS